MEGDTVAYVQCPLQHLVLGALSFKVGWGFKTAVLRVGVRLLVHKARRRKPAAPGVRACNEFNRGVFFYGIEESRG